MKRESISTRLRRRNYDNGSRTVDGLNNFVARVSPVGVAVSADHAGGWPRESFKQAHVPAALRAVVRNRENADLSLELTKVGVELGRRRVRVEHAVTRSQPARVNAPGQHFCTLCYHHPVDLLPSPTMTVGDSRPAVHAQARQVEIRLLLPLRCPALQLLRIGAFRERASSAST